MLSPTPAAKALRLAFLALAIVWSGVPIALVVLSSFKPPRDIFAVPPILFFTPTLDNYERLWAQWPGFFANMANSLIITAGATIVTAVASSMAGYVFSRYMSRWLTIAAFTMIVVRMLPPIVITLPLFGVVNWLRLNDTHLILIVLYATFFVSLSSWIMKAFIDQIPRELEEAAFVDGANLLQILRRVIVPLAANGLIASSIFVLVFAWNEYIFALIFTTRLARTTPLVISEILSTVEGVEWGVLFAAATVQLAPILAFVVAVQRYVIAGLAASAVKG